MSKLESRVRAQDLTKRAYHEADRALDKFATDKDEEALTLIVQAQLDLESAARALRVALGKRGEGNG